jgi:pimeloyl-ACP methyl ester carboxylesterase
MLSIPAAPPTASRSLNVFIRGWCVSRTIACVIVLLGTLLVGEVSVHAQPDPPRPRGERATGARERDRDTLRIPPRERVALTSRDGVALGADYYPGGFQRFGDTVRQVDGKSVVPVILVHGFGGQGSDFQSFAAGLQGMGHAVIVPDLRGHGQSLMRRTPAGMVAIEAERLRPAQLNAMIWDVEAGKRFFLEKNNEGLVNIELLAVVGAEFGALLALNWAVHDWNWPQLPAYKQGRDVKLLVLLSPPTAYRGMSFRAPLQHPMVGSRLPTFIAVGAKDANAVRDAERLFRFFERNHMAPERTVRFVQADTSLQGVQLLQGRGLTVGVDVARFLHTHLVERSIDFPWTLRQSPFTPATTD